MQLIASLVPVLEFGDLDCERVRSASLDFKTSISNRTSFKDVFWISSKTIARRWVSLSADDHDCEAAP